MTGLLLALALLADPIAPGGIRCPTGYAVQYVSGTKAPGRCVALATGATPAGVDGNIQVKNGSNLAAYGGAAACSAGQFVSALDASGATTCAAAGPALPLSGVNGGLGAAQPTCGAGQHVTCNGTSCSCSDDTAGAGTGGNRSTLGADVSCPNSLTVIFNALSIQAFAEFEAVLFVTHNSGSGTENFGISTTATDNAFFAWWEHTPTDAGSVTASTSTTNMAVTVASGVGEVVRIRGWFHGQATGTMTLRCQTTYASGVVKAGSYITWNP